jgi:hypothetical protein
MPWVKLSRGAAFMAMPDRLAESARQLRRLSDIASNLQLKCHAIPPPNSFLGTGFGLAWSDEEYVIVSVPGGSNSFSAYLTSGVFRDINKNALPALELTNSLTQSNLAFPAFLHDAEAGWDILMQQSYPVQLLDDVPQFFFSCLRSLAAAALNARHGFADRDLGGQPYRFTSADVQRLLLRAFA